MKVKFFQPLADIRNHYDDILPKFRSSKYGYLYLENWNVLPGEEDAIIEEREALRYLLGCQLMMVFDTNAKKTNSCYC